MSGVEAVAASPSAESPRIPGRELAGITALGCLFAVLLNLSLVTHITKVPADSADRFFQSWQLAWNGHALLSQPLDFLQSNAFWPLEDSAAFSDGLFGFTPAGLIGRGPEAALVRYNLVFLFCAVAAFAGAALLGRELGLRLPAAVLAGAAFAFAPFRLAHLNHLHVLGSAPIPLCLFLLLRGYRQQRPGLVFAGFVVAAWQVMIGFTLGIPLAYLLALLGALAAIRWWRTDPRPAVSRGVIKATVAGVAVLVLWSGFQAMPYLEVLRRHAEARRTVEFVEFYSPPLRAYLAAPPDSLLWGRASEAVRQGMTWAPEMALFPGVTVVVLALAGLALPGAGRRWRLGIALAALGSGFLALGFSNPPGRAVYGLLYHLAPGWQSSRTPGRLFTFTSLALALLAGMGAQALARRRSSPAGEPALPSRLVLAVPAVLTVLVLAEGAGRSTADSFADPPVRRLPQAGPQMHLPSGGFYDVTYMFWSTDGFPLMVNGYSGFTPDLQRSLQTELAGFPDLQTVERLRELGVRSVVLHPDLAAGTPWEGSEDRPVEGLGLGVSRQGGMVVFELAEGAPEGRAP
ncbi:MAG TPA: hypothetical protein VHJ78_08235 [Actinomycetota bacterium]|nr:hypothetical protein [Actinomycetota bacterium]